MKAHLRASLHECTGTVKDTDTDTDKAEDTNTHTGTHRHTLLWRKRRVGPVWKPLACWRGAKLDCIQLSSTSPRTRQVVIVAPFVPRLKSRFTRVMVISIWIQACLHRLSSRDRVRAGHQRALGDVTRGATQSVLFACSSRAGLPCRRSPPGRPATCLRVSVAQQPGTHLHASPCRGRTRSVCRTCRRARNCARVGRSSRPQA